MNKIINLFLIILILIFIFSVVNFYFSEKNVKETNSNRLNINKILKEKSLSLPILESDTENVIEYNSSYSEEIKNNKTRNFWKLLESKWKEKQLLLV